MLKKRTLAALLSLMLAGSMAVPACAWQETSHRAEQPGAGAAECSLLISRNPTIETQDTLLTRAQAVCILHQREGNPVVNFAMRYTDVDPASDYAEAVRWASSERIASGYGDGRFGPDDPVTREQLAVMLYRYVQRSGQGFTGSWMFLLPYEDRDEVSAFAYEAVCWMTMKDIMGAAREEAFLPGSQLTCGQAGTIFERCFQSMEQTEIANPFVSCETMEQAAEVAGFSMELPAAVSGEGYEHSIRAASFGLLEVVCRGEGDVLTLRKGLGGEDISGDCGTYPQVSTRVLDGHTLALKGSGDKVMTAIWCDGDYAYALLSEAGLNWESLSAVARDWK